MLAGFRRPTAFSLHCPGRSFCAVFFVLPFAVRKTGGGRNAYLHRSAVRRGGGRSERTFGLQVNSVRNGNGRPVCKCCRTDIPPCDWRTTCFATVCRPGYAVLAKRWLFGWADTRYGMRGIPASTHFSVLLQRHSGVSGSSCSGVSPFLCRGIRTYAVPAFRNPCVPFHSAVRAVICGRPAA